METDNLRGAILQNEQTGRQVYSLTKSFELERDAVAELKQRPSQRMRKNFLLKRKR